MYFAREVGPEARIPMVPVDRHRHKHLILQFQMFQHNHTGRGVKVVIFSWKSILVNFSAGSSDNDWAGFVPFAAQVNVRTQHMPIFGAEEASEGDLIDARLSHSEDAGIQIHAGILNTAAFIGELGLPHMLLGLVAGEGRWMAYGLQLVPHSGQLSFHFFLQLLQSLTYDFVCLSPKVSINFGIGRHTWNRNKEGGRGIVVSGKIERPPSASSGWLPSS